MLLLFAVLLCAASTPLDKYEKMLVDLPKADNCRATLKQLSARPHVFGVASVSDDIRDLVASSLAPIAGASVAEQPFSALSHLPLLRKVSFKANASSAAANVPVDEKVLVADPTSGDANITELWGAYGADTPNGDPTPYAPVVYANYCREEDYQHVESLGISFTGVIVLCRYGKIFRAQKVEFAEKREALGVLVYSDPQDDGFFVAVPYPSGPSRPGFGGQRGSYAYGQWCPGDPSPERVEKLCGNVSVLPTIPVQPLTWEAAEPILKSLHNLWDPNLVIEQSVN